MTTYSFRGHHCKDLTFGLSELGIEVGWISITGEVEPDWFVESRAINLSREFPKNLSIFRSLLLTLKAMREYKPDLVQTALFHAGIIGFVSTRILRIPLIHGRHHIDEHYQSGTFVHRLIDKLLARRADKVLVCSRAAKDWLVKREKVKEGSIEVINQGFDFERFNPSNSQVLSAKLDLELNETTFNIVCIARYSPVKGQIYLLEALEILLKNQHPEYSLHFIGPGDSRWLLKEIEQRKLGNFVKIHSERYDIPACIRAFDVVVHPSLADSFSQLIIEVQACGGALIATDIAAAKEQIIDGLTGLIVEPRSGSSIAEAIIRLQNKPELRKELMRLAPQHVRDNFDYKRMCREQYNLFRELLLCESQINKSWLTKKSDKFTP